MRLTASLHANDPAAWRRLFWGVLLVTSALRLALSIALPFTGDEAYFYFWGKNPDWGFYDHPPMVGWWLAALASISEHPAVLRLVAQTIRAGVRWCCGRRGGSRSRRRRRPGPVRCG
jgi:hypothetical protein